MNVSVVSNSLYNIPSPVQEVNLTSFALKTPSMWKRKGPGDHRQGSRQVLWEPEALAEHISGTWARAQSVSEPDGESGGSRLQLSPSHEPDVRWVTQPHVPHLKTMPMTTHPHVLKNQTTNPLTKCQPPSLLLSNHELSCALDTGQKSPKGTLDLWSEDRGCRHICHHFIKLKKIHFYLLTSLSSAFVLNFLTKHTFSGFNRVFCYIQKADGLVGPRWR